MKKRVLFIAGIIVLFILAIGYISYNKPYELKQGKYIEQTQQFSWIIFKNGSQFIFNRNNALSYRPTGTYTIKNGEIMLTVDSDNNVVYRFKIKKNKLIFEDDMGELLKKGAVFEYTGGE